MPGSLFPGSVSADWNISEVRVVCICEGRQHASGAREEEGRRPKKFASPVRDTDEQFSHCFDAAGTYPHYCSIHPKMTAQIVGG
jgi:plastocyanin